MMAAGAIHDPLSYHKAVMKDSSIVCKRSDFMMYISHIVWFVSMVLHCLLWQVVKRFVWSCHLPFKRTFTHPIDPHYSER